MVVLYIKVVKKIVNGSDHFVVVAKAKMRGNWKFRGNGKKEN